MKDDDVLWIKIYHIGTDTIMALPFWKHSPSLANAQKQGLEFVNKAAAEEINAATPFREVLDEHLTARWNIISDQRRMSWP